MTVTGALDVGVVGLGAMGSRMAALLLKQGHRVVVHDVREAAMEALVGAEPCDSPAAVAERVATAVLSLPDPQTVREVALGPLGLIHGAAIRICVDTSTTGPAVARSVAQELSAAGIGYVDAPVSGGVSELNNVTSCPYFWQVDPKAGTALLGKAHFEPNMDFAGRFEENARQRRGDTGPWRGFERAIHADHRDAIAYNNLGVVYYVARNYNAAIKNYEKAISYDDGAASYYSNLGAAYFGKKQFDKAIRNYARAVDLDPDIFERTSHAGVMAQLPAPQERAYYDYVLAKLYARNGLSDRSLHYLKKAMEEGYKDIKNVYKDNEFSVLRKDPRFTELMASKTLSISD